MTRQKKRLHPIVISEEMCERADCQLCEELNKLGHLIKERGEYTNTIKEQMWRCFCH